MGKPDFREREAKKEGETGKNYHIPENVRKTITLAFFQHFLKFTHIPSHILGLDFNFDYIHLQGVPRKKVSIKIF